jgi:hypothetical protein
MQHSQEYVKNPAISQSDLKLFEENIVRFHKEKILGEIPEEKKGDHFDLGNLVDTILIAPEMKSMYYVVTDYKAAGKLRDVMDRLFNTCKAKYGEDWLVETASREKKIVTLLEVDEQMMREAITAEEWQNNWKMDTKVAKIKDLGAEYWTQLLEAEGKVMVSLENWTKAHSVADDILEDEFIGRELQALKTKPEDENVVPSPFIVHKHAVLFGVFRSTKMKGEVDFFIQDVGTNTIWPWDVKSAKSLAQFKSNYRKFRYGRQGSYYSNLIVQNFPGYTVKPFQFLVIPTESGEYPEKFTMSESELYACADGFESKNGYRIKGWKDLIAEYEWHEMTGKWKHKKEYYETGTNLLKPGEVLDPALLDVPEEVIF